MTPLETSSDDEYPKVNCRSFEAIAFWVVVAAFIALGVGLGVKFGVIDKPSDETGTVSMQFQQQTLQRRRFRSMRFAPQQANGLLVTPEYLGMKFLGVYLWTDYDVANHQRINDDVAPLVWQNPECFPFGNECNTPNVKTFFNFSADLSAINDEINSQNRSIPVGNYHYVQMAMCKHQMVNGTHVNSTDANLQFLAGSMNETFNLVSDSCATWSARAVPPITVLPNRKVDVTLTFTLHNLCAQTTTTSVRCAPIPPATINGTDVDAICCESPRFVISFEVV